MTITRARRRRPGRTIYCAIHFDPARLNELVSMCGLLRLDIDLTPTREELREAIRELVFEAIDARVRRANQQRLSRGRRRTVLPLKRPEKGETK